MVLEGDLINLGVTSPAAALALGLMYLQTNDAAVAAAFQLPDTHFALDFVQPDHLTLRMLMRSLGGWAAVPMLLLLAGAGCASRHSFHVLPAQSRHVSLLKHHTCLCRLVQ